jgi:hypothetical protein
MVSGLKWWQSRWRAWNCCQEVFRCGMEDQNCPLGRIKEDVLSERSSKQ